MNLPASDSREDVAAWLGRIFIQTRLDTKSSKQANLAQADAVLALVNTRLDAVTRERDEAVRRVAELSSALLLDYPIYPAKVNGDPSKRCALCSSDDPSVRWCKNRVATYHAAPKRGEEDYVHLSCHECDNDVFHGSGPAAPKPETGGA